MISLHAELVTNFRRRRVLSVTVGTLDGAGLLEFYASSLFGQEDLQITFGVHPDFASVGRSTDWYNGPHDILGLGRLLRVSRVAPEPGR